MLLRGKRDDVFVRERDDGEKKAVPELVEGGPNNQRPKTKD